ncbi:MAG: methenyltetrahydrofolate cyclohydrolase [Bacteroidetes bacterium]|nr:MAG: methenyltetrahydrofolate cyclohydrolase [Bacteroidota bacterium]
MGTKTLTGIPVQEFLDKLAEDSPAPGGGSVAALAAALASSLCAMVARLTLGRDRYRDAWSDMERVRDAADKRLQQFVELMDLDTEAYNGVIAAFRMPKENDEQIAARKKAIEAANKEAAQVPLETLRNVHKLVPLVGEVLSKGNPNCLTDAGVAAQLTRAAALGAAYNVRINLSGIKDEPFSTRLEKEVNESLNSIEKSVEEFGHVVEQGLK